MRINQIYQNGFTAQHRYLVLFGGAGSGKSYFCAQKLIHRIRANPYERFLVIRKVERTLRNSTIKQIKRVIADSNLGKEFRFLTNNRSFIHKPTGNEIICSGLDDPEKLKSIADISSIWIEEATELSQDDFDQLDLRLRGTTPSYKQILLSFNPVDENHWLKTRFADKNPPLDNTLIIHSTYAHNPFIDAEYIQILKQKATDNPNYYQIYCLGAWGKKEIKNPFAYNFNPEKHIAHQLTINPNYPLYFSFDFNVNPFVCLVLQIWKDSTGEHIHFLHEITLSQGDIYTMAEHLKAKYGAQTLSNSFFTGDAMQQKREITQRQNLNAWIILQKELAIHPNRLQVPKANPNIQNSRMLLNALLARHPDFIFAPDMKHTLHDLRFVEADPEGKIIKTSRTNPNQRADHLDALRYATFTWCHAFLNA